MSLLSVVSALLSSNFSHKGLDALTVIKHCTSSPAPLKKLPARLPTDRAAPAGVAPITAANKVTRRRMTCPTMLTVEIRICTVTLVLSDDIRNAFQNLKTFTTRVDDADRLDEEHLLPIALEVFGSVPFPVTTEYVPIKKTSKSTTATLARRLYFDSYYSFVVTDFFEGLHHGHYPRQCGICSKYFLMTSARRQQYCNGIAPYEVRGRKTTCRKYAASINRKELAAADPVVDIYNRRCSAIRTEKGRGTITETFAAMATELAREYKFKALQNSDYASGQYALDMSRERLYAETDKRLK